MLTVTTVEVRNDFRNICQKAEKGERVLILRPKQKNLILISEEEFTKLGAVTEEPLSKFAVLSNFFGIAKSEGFHKSDKEILEEGLVNKYESID